MCPGLFYSLLSLFLLLEHHLEAFSPSVCLCRACTGTLCHQQQSHTTTGELPGTVGSHAEGTRGHLLSCLFIYTNHSQNGPQPIFSPTLKGSGPQRGCDCFGKPDTSPTPLAASACSPSRPQGCVKAAKQLSQSPGLFMLVQKCCEESIAGENTSARMPSWLRLHAGTWRLLRLPCSEPTVLVSCQHWHQGVSLDCW